MESEIERLRTAALAHLQGGRVDAAAAAINELLRADPSSEAGWAMRGAVEMRRRQPLAALACFDQAVALRPDDGRLHNDRGNALLSLGRIADALASFERALTLAPDLVFAHSNRARALNALDKPDAALAAADRALELDSRLANAWRHRGAALLNLERFGEALGSYRAALGVAMPGQRWEVLTDMGMALAALGRHGEAIAAYDEASAANPAASLPRYRRGHARLSQGDFAGGWDDYEARWEGVFAPGQVAENVTAELRDRFLFHPTAETLRGRRVLVVDEQGVGDKIMFASVVPDLLAVASEVTCVFDPRLLSLLSNSMPGLKLIAGRGPGLFDPDAFDVVMALGSLPAAFRRSAAAFPGLAYLAPRSEVTEAWTARMGPREARLRIGLSWRGGLKRTRESARSMELETLRPLLERVDCSFVSLQYGDVADELAAFNPSLARPITSFPATEIDDFEQLAGLTCALDLVVSVQTALAHLTGAIGQEGLIMIPQSPEWRYGATGSTMPWYDSLRLFRQTGAGGWSSVIGQVGRALDDAVPKAP